MSNMLLADNSDLMSLRVSGPLKAARRIVVKVGSSLVTNEGRGLDEEAIGQWSQQLAALVQEGRELIMVSSGAVAEGMKRLGWTVRPKEINALQAGGNTSIMLGMKWGLTLIDPAARPMFAELAASNLIPAAFAARPFNYNDREAMKVIVLMTDGEHVSHSSITDPYKTGTAPIWQSTGDGNYSVHHPSYTGSANKYWVPHRSEWRAAPWNSGAGVQQQTWQQVWSKLRLSYVSWQFYARALGTSGGTRTTVYNNTMNTMQKTFESVANMNAQLQQSCALAKTNNVVVFGIAFEAPTSGQAQISACASSAAHYFNAQGLQIQTAFRSIASNISQLKLTQ